MNTLDLSSDPLQIVHFDLDAKTQNTFKYFQSPSHQNSSATQIVKQSDSYYTMEYGDEDFYPDKDVRIEMETLRDEVEFSLLTYTPAPEDSFGTDNFYAIWITPPDSITEDERIPLDIIFTADVSSSMEGERINQVKQSLTYFLDELSQIDRFNIITFGTHVVPFHTDLIFANPINIQAAHQFVSQLYALGMTNIDAAFDSTLHQSFGDTTSNNIIFLTDGYPTIGEAHPDSIADHIVQWNSRDVRIFSFGVGEDISRSLLTRISKDNHGYATFIASEDSIALLVNNHFIRINKPILSHLSLDYSSLDPWDRYPKTLMDLFWGSQVLEMGLYTESGTHNVTLSGQIRSETKQFSKSMTFPDTAGGYRFVPRLWAREKINHLLELIDIYGESEELVNQIIDLSLRFGILTEYTAFYSDPNGVEQQKDTALPKEFQLIQNYPNPFNPETTIKYALPADQALYNVTVKIYDALGRLVIILINEQQKPGIYTAKWNGENSAGEQVPTGVYFCAVQAGSYKAVQKMLLIR